MQPLPHEYSVSATFEAPDVILRASGLDRIASQPPREFGGPGTLWSPETLLVAAVADCYVLSFRAIAEASRYKWLDLRCTADATLDREGNTTRFTRVHITPQLTIPAGASESRAMRLLEKAKENCLVTNSLSAEIVFVPGVTTTTVLAG